MPGRLKVYMIVVQAVLAVCAGIMIVIAINTIPAIAFLLTGIIIAILFILYLARYINAPNKLDKATELANLLLDATPFVATLWNRENQIFYSNKEALKIFGLDSKEEFYDKFFEYSPQYQPDGQLSSSKAAGFIQKAFNEGSAESAWIHKLPDGTLFPAKIELVRVNYENDYAVAAYLHDLRDHKKMMDEVEHRDNLLRMGNRAAAILLTNEQELNIDDSIISSLELAAVSVDADRIQIWRNEMHEGSLHFIRIYEWLSYVGRAKTLMSSAKKISYTNKPEWEKLFKRGGYINSPVSSMPPEDQAFFQIYEIKSKAIVPLFLHDEFWGLFTIDDCRQERILTDDEINIMRSIGLMTANAIIRNEMMLDVRDSSVKLEAALLESQKANSAKSSFLAKMSHEMRTPLNAVIGLSGLCLESHNLDNEIFSNLEKIYNSGSTLLATVNDVLDISKIEAGKMELVEIEYDVPSLINDSVTQNMMRIGEKLITFDLQLNDQMYSYLYGDELRVRQIMNNLLSNAIKYTDEGLVELEMDCERDGDDVWLTIIVRDTGRGIIESNIDKLFTNYTQLDLEYNRTIEGTGLGLPIAKTLSEMMDGEIKVESVYGKGSVFTVRIKQRYVSDSKINKEVIESLKGSRYSSGKLDLGARLNRVSLPYAHVLIVDDNITNLEVAKGLMKPYGMQIDCVINGQMAIDAIKSESVLYNAIFMDHMMPGMDGIEALFRIRDIGTDYAINIPIIALTANAITGNEEMFYNSGFQAFLSKPVDITRLDEVIRRWVRNKDLEKAITDRQHEIEEKLALGMEDDEKWPDPIERRSGVERRRTVERRNGTERRVSEERRHKHAYVGGAGQAGEAGNADGGAKQAGEAGNADGGAGQNRKPDSFETPDRSNSSTRLTSINIDNGIKRFNGDKSVYYNILHSFASSSRPLLESIQYVSEDNLHDYAIVVHGIKGASRGIFANSIGDAAESLERAAKTGDVGYIYAHNKEFLKNAWRLIYEIEKLIPNKM